MRIITGKYKGRHFDIPRSFKARPTTDFAKENIFNVLTQYVDFEGAVALDLFSGTGSISLELLSRGCQRVVSVEMDRDHHRFIQECVKKLGASSLSSRELQLIHHRRKAMERLFLSGVMFSALSSPVSSSSILSLPTRHML